MKLFVIAGCALAAAVALSGCVSPGLPDLAAVKQAAPAAASSDPAAIEAASKARLDFVKEANRHIEQCHRTYTLGWPFSGLVDCPSQSASASAFPSADVLAAAIAAAVAKAMTPAAPPAPAK